jgi:hypothetical protein
MEIQCAFFEAETKILLPILSFCSQALKITKNWTDTIVSSALQLVWRVLE